ncbi:2OG-Fe(II) oxygenase [Parerythrobacter jejuensis]|uniref:2OG-Fe(II) oxygenase n=1 Tax=Parerythrobacter jejuensis TaxID=795812 RepID=A0A845ARA4_9SPHN|nr:2OG-Fe(II) oxygenase [Parerythrobacter jejuensis]MXP32840.1 2OG-Fe(II) oxygenase [Parerythrobacter jejuensis]
MNSPLVPNHIVIDEFLAIQDAANLLDFAIASQSRFKSASVRAANGQEAVTAQRDAMKLADLGPFRRLFREAVKAEFANLCDGTGVQAFDIAAWDIELAVHRDGGHFRKHVDTLTAAGRLDQPGDRMISLVYYLQREPARFSGGALVISPFAGDSEPIRIAPRHNRLVAFPSIAWHEVEDVAVPGNAWDAARFSVNCWLLRARD